MLETFFSSAKDAKKREGGTLFRELGGQSL